jgi:hypothetical protein
MKCAHCGGSRFGLETKKLLTFRGWLYFCKETCKNDHLKHELQELRKKQFLKWLHDGRSTA